MDFLQTNTLFGTSYLNYLYCILSIIVAIILIIFIKKVILPRMFKLVKKTKTKADDIMYYLVRDIVTFVFIFPAIYFGKSFINFSPDIAEYLDITLFVAIVASIAFVIDRFFQDIIFNIIAPIFEKTETKLDNQLLPIIRTSAKFLVWLFAFLMILSNLGYDFTSIIAGLGIGGLAVALAAQQTLGNFFASIAIFSDQPFQVDDLVKVDGVLGNIKQVGFRSTRIQTLEGTEVVIPNSKVADAVIENVTKRPTVRQNMKIGIVYATTVKKLEKAVDIIRNIINKEKKVEDDSYVTFEEYGDSSLNISISYWIQLQESWVETLSVKHRINLEIKKQFEKEGIEFAFPTRHVLMEEVK